MYVFIMKATESRGPLVEGDTSGVIGGRACVWQFMLTFVKSPEGC